MQIARFAQILSLATVALVATAGCSGSDTPQLGTVSGVVTLDGAPHPNARVTFSPTQGRPSEGVTDATGKYELSYLPGVKGAVPGDHVVSITTQYQAPENPGSEPPFIDPIPAKYNVASTLKANVAAGPQEQNFALTSK